MCKYPNELKYNTSPVLAQIFESIIPAIMLAFSIVGVSTIIATLFDGFNLWISIIEILFASIGLLASGILAAYWLLSAWRQSSIIDK